MIARVLRAARHTLDRLVVTAAVLCIGGCDAGSVSAPGAADGAGQPTCKTDATEWPEGVKLFNGEEVVVWRRAVACKGGFPDSARGRDLEFELKYEPMDVHWKAPSGLKPRSFELIDGVPHLGLYVMTGGQCRDAPADKPLGRMMKWVNRQWVEVPMAEAPLDRALVNLYTDYWGHTAKGDAKGFVPARGKTTGWRSTMTLKEFFAMDAHTCELYHAIERRRGPFAAPASAGSK